MYVLLGIEFVADDERKVRRAVNDIERLGKAASMHGKLEDAPFDIKTF